MSFIEYMLKKGPDPKVNLEKIFFAINKFKLKKSTSYRLIIYIGEKIAEQIKIRKGDRISFSYDSENPRIWLIKKSTNGGYRVSSSGKRRCKIQITLDIFQPEERELGRNEANFEIQDGQIIMYPKED